MAKGKNGEILQAVEIGVNTFIGTASTATGGAGSTVHATAPGNITFHFPGKTQTVAVEAGVDFVAGPNCTGITSTAGVIIS